MSYESFWTEARIKLLRKYVEEDNFTFQHIATLLRCSRNAALSKSNRLKLEKPKRIPQRSTKVKAKEPSKKKLEVKKPAKEEAPTKSKRVETPANKGTRQRVRLPPELKSDKAFAERVEELKPRVSNITNIPGNFQCHWIHGDVKSGEAYYCAKPALKGTKWCTKHYKLVYQTSADRAKAQRFRQYMGIPVRRAR